jgi:DNA mismatch endonuclease (patch repair protein)
MADIFTKKKRSEIMSLIKPKGTKPEVLVFRYLRKNKIYFQKHYKRVVGSPDVAVPSKKLAVFIDGDFWHGWKFAQRRHKLPKVYWRAKIEANIRRDKKTFATLRRKGWRVMRVWEHDLVQKKRGHTLNKVTGFLEGLKTKS